MASQATADGSSVENTYKGPAVQRRKNVADIEAVLEPIREQILGAVKALFDRSIASPSNPDNPQITDNKARKKSLPESGPLQDCEFGMILLLVKDWMGDDFFENAGIDPEAFQRVIIAVVKRTVKRLIQRELRDEGGAGDSPVFFSGAPYTRYGRDLYSANLDAAMLAVAFFAMALKQYDHELTETEHGVSPKLPDNIRPPSWVSNARNAALYIVQEGLRYALKCRVTVEGKGFIGFTCDPENSAASSRGDDLLSDVDRLFFTWTACETIHDLIEWRDSYVRPVVGQSLPDDVLRDIVTNIADLHKSLKDAAAWSAKFRDAFQKLQVEDRKISELVKDINTNYDEKSPISPEDDKRVREMSDAVLNVYHICQYAAVRSLGPESTINLDEAGLIADKLNRLVTYGIVGSKLDISKQQSLYESLTRKYWLGRGEGKSKEEYEDDAWYPLVVRSLSGLLSRTLDDIGQRFTRSQVTELVKTYEKILEYHYVNLTDRRPSNEEIKAEPKLIKLWSYADNQPYLLYATQRTIFALVEYSKFVRKATDFSTETEPGIDERERELSMLLARKFAEVLIGPEIKRWIADLPAATPAQVGSAENDKQSISLPAIEWAASIVRNWLDGFVLEFNNAHIAKDLDDLAGDLERVRGTLEKDKSRKTAAILGGKYTEILQVNDHLKKAGMDPEPLKRSRGILLAHLFREYLEHLEDAKSLRQLLNAEDDNSLWQRIRNAATVERGVHSNT